ncbi:MAG: TonB-dependent receptor [Gemmatimonadetes bacterium]|nr:TonB-dependent receptor [Gemmatimonadota bacterium]
MEAALRWASRGGLLSGSFAYTYLDARDLTDDRALAYRPRHLVAASAALRPGSVEFGLDYRYAARVERVQVWPDDERVAMSVLDLRAGYRFGRYAVLFSGENLLNYAYTTIERNLEPIRSFSLAVQGEF